MSWNWFFVCLLVCFFYPYEYCISLYTWVVFSWLAVLHGIPLMLDIACRCAIRTTDFTILYRFHWLDLAGGHKVRAKHTYWLHFLAYFLSHQDEICWRPWDDFLVRFNEIWKQLFYRLCKKNKTKMLICIWIVVNGLDRNLVCWSILLYCTFWYYCNWPGPWFKVTGVRKQKRVLQISHKIFS